MKFEFLGTADTGGIPLHNCMCDICQEAREKGINNRSTCAYLELDDKSVILFDAGSVGLCETFNTVHVRAIFLTHFHADHCLGLIRLRKSVNQIICYTPQDKDGFGDLYRNKDSIKYKPLLPFKAVKIDDVTVYCVPLFHSRPTYGYVVKTKKHTLAYLTDCAKIPVASMKFLKKCKVKTVFLDASYVSMLPSKKHLSCEIAEKYLDELKVENGYFIHASCKTLLALRKSGITPKYRYIEKGFSMEV
ncbi:MAG: MBL fold metallo-hydrolase [Sulfurospirillaceae bacterium]|nr:MBL fold metallo-hydrolase [Sulfurospirillaceae bacterium]